MDEQIGYYTAFTAGLRDRSQLHRDQLPRAPRSWKEMLRHPYKDGFLAAAMKEYKNLSRRGTFKSRAQAPGIKTVPVI